MRVYEEIEPIIKAYKADYPQLAATITDENIVISDPSSIAGDFVEALAAYCRANYVGWIVASVNDIATIIIPNKEI